MTRIVFSVILLGISSMASALPEQVRVINKTNQVIYIHKGGYSASVQIQPRKWHVFSYPFEVVPPGHSKKEKTSLLVASAGGRWLTTPNGYTYLAKPTLLICLDYNSSEYANKTGNRKWEINKANGIEKGCELKGYKQPWFQPAAN